MDVWVTRASRKTKCVYCGENLVKGEPMVKGKSWRKGGKAKKWVSYYRWHIKCWEEQALKWLENHPPAVREKSGGRKKMDLPDEARIARNKLLQRYAFITYQQRQSAKKNPIELERILKLEVFRQQVIEEIRQYGPVPTKWKVGDASPEPTPIV